MMDKILADYRFFYKNIILKSISWALMLLLLILVWGNISYLQGYIIGYLLGVFNFYLLSRDVEIFSKKELNPRKAKLFSFSRYGLRFFTIFGIAYLVLNHINNINFIFLLVGFLTLKFVIYVEFFLKRKLL